MCYRFMVVGLWLCAFLVQAFYEPQGSISYKQGRYRKIGQIQLLYPIRQSANQLLYSHVMGLLDSDKANEGNFGLGYRVLQDAAVIGGYGFYDIRRTPYQHFAHQLTLGLEYLAAKHELRGNVYMPFSRPKVIDPSSLMLKSNGTWEAVAVQNQLSKATPLSGLDMEWGIKSLGLSSLQLWVSYYYFYASGLKPLQGSRVRLAYQLRPWLKVESEWSYDQIRGWNYFIGIQLSWAAARSALVDRNALTYKMTQMPVRDIDVIIREHQWEDSGPTEPTFVISTPKVLQSMGSGLDGMTLDANYMLAADLDLSEFQTVMHEDGMKGFKPIGTDRDPFKGRFSGQGHTLTGLFMEGTQKKQSLGLFGVARGRAEKPVLIEKVYLTNVSVKGQNKSSIGGLAGIIENTIIRKVSSQGHIEGGKQAIAGGLIGSALEQNYLSELHSSGEVLATDGAILGGLIGITSGVGRRKVQLERSYSHSQVIGHHDTKAGGLVGLASESKFSRVYSHSEVSIGDKVELDHGLENRAQAGGLIGRFNDGDLIDAYSTGLVQGGEGTCVGGLIGAATGDSLVLDTHSYSIVKVAQEGIAGGLIGFVYSDLRLIRAYSKGSVQGGYGQGTCLGGLVGGGFRAQISHVYSLSSVWGGNEAQVGGIMGRSVSDCLQQAYSAGALYGGKESCIGGIIGTIDSGSLLEDVYSRSDIEVKDEAIAGGLIGKADALQLKRAYFSGTLKGPLSATIHGLFGKTYDDFEATAVYWNEEKLLELKMTHPNFNQQIEKYSIKSKTDLTNSAIFPSWFEDKIWVMHLKGPELLWPLKQDALTLLRYLNSVQRFKAIVFDLPLELEALIFFYTAPHRSLTTGQVLRLISYASMPIQFSRSFPEKARVLWTKDECLVYVIEARKVPG